MNNYKLCLIILISFLTYNITFAQQKGAWRSIDLPENFDTREWASTAWTGTEFIYWRGSTTAVQEEDREKIKGKGRIIVGNGFYYTDGWLINPKTGKVRKMASSGLPISVGGYKSVWTGKYLFVRAGEYNMMKLYDPQLNKWKNVSLRGAPLDKRINCVMIWTGKEVFIWGGSNYAGNIKMNTGFLYNPETNRWRKAAPSILSGRKGPAISKTDKEIIIWGAFWGKIMDGAAYNFITNTWRKIADCPFKQPKMQFVPYIMTTWTGKECLFFGGNAVAYNPTTNQWRDLKLRYAHPTMISSNYNTWDGQRVFSVGGVWDYATGKFSKFPRRAYAPNDVVLETWLDDFLFVLADKQKKAYMFDPKTAYAPPTFTTKAGTFTDPRDNQKYRTITVGKQTWMVENLRYNAPESTTFDLKPENIKYGKMYSAKTAAAACPPGWRLPEKKDFIALLDQMGGEVFAHRNLFPTNPKVNKFKGTGKSGLNIELVGGKEYSSYGGWAYHVDFWALPQKRKEYSKKTKTRRYVMAPGYIRFYDKLFFQSTLNSKSSTKQRFYIRCIKK